MLVGKPVKRINDRKFLQGLAQYVADLKIPGMVYMHVVRSRYPHAWIKEIDVDKAYGNGAIAAYTHEDIGPVEIDVEEAVEGAYPAHQKILAEKKARYVGEPLAVVVSDSFIKGFDIAEKVEVLYEPLEAVSNPVDALKPDAPMIHDHLGSNVYFKISRQSGDVDEAFDKAEETVEIKLRIQRVVPSAMEPRGVVAVYNKSNNSFTVYASTQNPHSLREFLARKLEVSQNSVRVVAPDVGGGFGAKLQPYPEYLLASILAKRLGRPVGWFGSRMEDFTTTSHGRDMQAFLQIATTRAG
ncbi:MAG: molybdopterin cofactor-binding domain-containing protein, partial [Candidatus Caldarchaeum sp.]|nr:molybdopterin cofactor-binding domain-containing protein [Candidatus Caldarchaeum sp.]